MLMMKRMMRPSRPPLSTGNKLWWWWCWWWRGWWCWWRRWWWCSRGWTTSSASASPSQPSTPPLSTGNTHWRTFRRRPTFCCCIRRYKWKSIFVTKDQIFRNSCSSNWFFKTHWRTFWRRPQIVSDQRFCCSRRYGWNINLCDKGSNLIVPPNVSSRMWEEISLTSSTRDWTFTPRGPGSPWGALGWKYQGWNILLRIIIIIIIPNSLIRIS